MKKLITLLGTILLLAAVGLTTTVATAVSANAVSAVRQAKPEKRLAKAAADALVGELKEGLADLIEDEEAVAAIVKKWDARNLAGQTRPQILGVLFADVKSVVEDKEAQDTVWEVWQEVGLEDEEAEEETPVETPQKPANPQANPAANVSISSNGRTSVIRPIEISDDFTSSKYENYEKVRITELFTPTTVCSAADKKALAGGRFITGGPCLRHIQERIPNNNSPAYDCEKAHGVGNCALLEIQIPGSQYKRQLYVKKSPAGFEFYWESLDYALDSHSEVTSWTYHIYYARPK